MKGACALQNRAPIIASFCYLHTKTCTSNKTEHGTNPTLMILALVQERERMKEGDTGITYSYVSSNVPSKTFGYLTAVWLNKPPRKKKTKN